MTLFDPPCQRITETSCFSIIDYLLYVRRINYFLWDEHNCWHFRSALPGFP